MTAKATAALGLRVGAAALAALAGLGASFAEAGGPGAVEPAELERRSLERIREALEGLDGQLAGVAIGYASELDEPWVGAGLAKAARHPDPNVRIAALFALAASRPDEAGRLLRDVLESGDEPQVVRLAAEQKLAELGDPEARALLLPLLEDADPLVRVLAAGGLLKLGDETGLALLEAALDGPDPALRVDAASELLDAGRHRARALAALADVLRNAEGGLVSRSNAAYALGETTEPEAVPLLVEALKDAERGVRLAAASSLALMARRMGPLLMEMAVHDPDYLVRLEAIHGLEAVEGPRVEKALRAALEDPVPMVRLAAAAALGPRAAGERATLVRIAARELASEDYTTRVAAIATLGRIADERAVSSLEPLLDDPDPMTALTTAVSLHRLLRAR